MLFLLLADVFKHRKAYKKEKQKFDYYESEAEVLFLNSSTNSILYDLTSSQVAKSKFTFADIKVKIHIRLCP